MEKLIRFDVYPVKDYMKVLLSDKTTKKNIVFATDSYVDVGSGYGPEHQMTEELIQKLEIQPRIAKALEEQSQRTRKKAEVFTPAWLCCKMNNHCDDDWFERENVFNTMDGEKWTVTDESVTFPEKKTWKQYVDSRRLEITCGEAPYVVSRYDASTGEMIELKNRIGILDRKIRIVNENTNNREEWLKWTLRAFESVYGYEWQGDSLLIARINLLLSFMDYYEAKWPGCRDDIFKKTLTKIANVIAWNFWQMDGLKGTVPYSKQIEKEVVHQINLFDMGWGTNTDNTEEDYFKTKTTYQECQIFDWRSRKPVLYSNLKKGE